VTTERCVGKASGECRGPIVADLAVRAKRGHRNAGNSVKVPLCVVHTVKGARLSWFARAGAWLLPSTRGLISEGDGEGARITHRIVPREPWRSVLRDMGILPGASSREKKNVMMTLAGFPAEVQPWAW